MSAHTTTGSRLDGSMRVVRFVHGRQLVKTNGRYFDYRRSDGLTLVGRFPNDTAAADAWRRMLRGEGA